MIAASLTSIATGSHRCLCLEGHHQGDKQQSNDQCCIWAIPAQSSEVSVPFSGALTAHQHQALATLHAGAASAPALMNDSGAFAGDNKGEGSTTTEQAHQWPARGHAQASAPAAIHQRLAHIAGGIPAGAGCRGTAARTRGTARGQAGAIDQALRAAGAAVRALTFQAWRPMVDPHPPLEAAGGGGRAQGPHPSIHHPAPQPREIMLRTHHHGLATA